MILCSLLILLLPLRLSFAGFNHLEPVAGPFNNLTLLEDYYSKVKTVLFKDASEFSVARMVSLPSFGPESVVSVEGEAGKERKIIYRFCAQRIWDNEEWQRIGVTVQEKTIDVETAAQIEAVFSKAIMQVKYPKDHPFRLDGISYYFTSGMQAGGTWSPADGTIPGLLVSYGDTMIKYVQSDDKDAQQLINVLRSKGSQLLDALDKAD